ncbi:metal-dependent hydrolase [Mariniflexile litorale]|uniref:Metal-dependent hydrolase n=1 Tax=Mariniflexile litorale TaxID=3045158 RepID=A0AAU7ED58_9FLAO|nr:metal-dependent hydrolase [Mariniflexile sp. KMM 9835]MDQ8211572.1 metal-dependent hydrolase [Mariniflexile sp. KMM 9835]
MDSLTQIVLGAACGEAVLGKKIGNKALLFGGIGGTIPDLDVYIGNIIYNHEIDAMLFHRGFMHSILFSILAAFILGWAVFKLYNSGKRIGTTTLKSWILLFFWSLFTHPILDCFTPYGTQLFAPFSNYRVAFNNIAVVDPLYTLPFLVCMIVLMFFNRTNNRRRFWLKLGLGMSSVYMILTIINKLYVDTIFRKSITESNLKIYRFSTQASIFNNILWYGIAESDISYYVSYYSLLDSKNKFLNFVELPKQRDLKPEDFNDIKNLAWFSNQYYSIYKIGDNQYQYNDLRYPLLDEKKPNSSVFSMLLFKENQRLNMKPFQPKTEDFNKAMVDIWLRLKGI